MPQHDAWQASWAGAWDPTNPSAEVKAAAAPPPEDPKLVEVFTRHQDWTDTLIAGFERALKPMISTAMNRTIEDLEDELSVTDGTIDPTAANDKVLAGVDDLFMEKLNAAGYRKLVSDYTASYSDQLPFLQDMLDVISNQLGHTAPAVSFSATDLRILGRLQSAAAGKLDSIFAGAARLAMDRVKFSIAALAFDDLTKTLADAMETTAETAKTWADTSVSMYYRSASSLQFAEIQEEQPDAPLKFRYSGPSDLKTRPFCLSLLIAGRSYTRAEIDAMSNGQLPGTFTSCGGFNCRHLFVLTVD